MSSYSRSSHTDGGVSVGGTILNMLSNGFSLEDCIGEPVDDSLGAEAKVIRLHLDTPTRESAFSDSGKGMVLEVLGDSAVLNNRSEKPSKIKRGRFGIGRHTSCATLTGAQHATTTLSKHEDDSDVFAKVGELVTNWPEIIKSNRHTPVPQFISYPNQAKWLKYAIDPKKRGTVTINPCTKEVFDQLFEKVKTKDITNSLVFNLGRGNYEPIEKGLKLSIVVDGVETPVPAYNPIPLDKVAAENKEVILMKVYRNETTKKYLGTFLWKGVNSYLKFGELDKNGNKKRVAPVTVDTKVMEGFDFRGNVKITNAWMQNWEYIDYEMIGPDWIGAPNPTSFEAPKDGSKPKKHFKPEVSALLNGRFIKRDDKIISHHVKPAKKDGHKSAYDYYNYVRQMLEFCAEELDDEFGTMLNKGKIEEKLIIEAIIETCNKLRDWFARDLHKRDFPNVKAQDDSDDGASVAESIAESVASTRIVNSGPTKPIAVAAKPVAAVAKPVAASAKPVAAPANPVIASMIAAAASDSLTAPVAAAPAAAAAAQLNTQTVVTGHMRGTSKSEKDVLVSIRELAEKLFTSNIDEKIATASNVSKPGLATVFKNIREIYDFLEEADVTFEEDE